MYRFIHYGYFTVYVSFLLGLLVLANYTVH